MLNFKQEYIDKANYIIDLHLKSGLDLRQSRIAAISTIDFSLEIGVYPAHQMLVKGARSYIEYLISKD